MAEMQNKSAPKKKRWRSSITGGEALACGRNV